VKKFVAVLLLAAAARAQIAPATWQRLEGEHSGITAPLAVAVRDQQKWTKIWREHDPADPVPPVDFTRENVVVVVLGERLTAGVTVSVVVQQDPLDASRLNVFYREIDSKKAFSADVICQPYAIVKVRRAAVIDIEPDGTMATPEHPTALQLDPAKLVAPRPFVAPSFTFDGR